MKFLVDECVGQGVADWLERQGYDTKSILDTFPGIADEMVLEMALEENRILVTMDKDFGDLIFRGNIDHCGIILLRLLNWQLKNKITVLEKIFMNHMHEFENNFIVVTEQSIRIVRQSKIH